MSLYVDIQKNFKGFSLDIKFETNGGILGILGASGCGKSLTLKCIAGIETPERGKIILNDQVLFDSEKKINIPPQKRHIGYLFQDYALFPNMTVEQNIGVGIDQKGKHKKVFISQMLALFQLEGLGERYPSQLSGGQKQRVALARIIASKPDVLLLDEPFAALDYYLKETLQLKLAQDLKRFDGDILMVTHSRDEVYRLTEKMLIIDYGRLMTSGYTKDIFKEPRYLKAARMTGCKNISAVEVTGTHEILAKDWDVRFRLSEEVDKSVKYVGIRAHYFERDARPGCAIEPELVKIIEDPFELNIVFKKKSAKSEGEIWWKLSKTEWYNKYHETLPETLYVADEHIMLLEE